MQPSECYRRGVVLACDQIAEDSLRHGNVDKDIYVKVLTINDQVFSSLWQIGLFEAINELCGSLVDDYEDEIIEASCVHRIINAIDSLGCTESFGDNIITFLNDLRMLSNQSIELSRPLMFVL